MYGNINHANLLASPISLQPYHRINTYTRFRLPFVFSFLPGMVSTVLGKKYATLLLSAAASACASTLVNFQVAEPPPVPSDVQTCAMMVLE